MAAVDVHAAVVVNVEIRAKSESFGFPALLVGRFAVVKGER